MEGTARGSALWSLPRLITTPAGDGGGGNKQNIPPMMGMFGGGGKKSKSKKDVRPAQEIINALVAPAPPPGPMHALEVPETGFRFSGVVFGWGFGFGCRVLGVAVWGSRFGFAGFHVPHQLSV